MEKGEMSGVWRDWRVCLVEVDLGFVIFCSGSKSPPPSILIH